MYALSTIMFVTVLLLLILINMSPAEKKKVVKIKRFGKAQKFGRFFFQRLVPVAMAVLIIIGGFIYGLFITGVIILILMLLICLKKKPVLM